MFSKEITGVFYTEFTARFCMWSIISQLLVYLMSIHWKTSSEQLYLVGAALSLSFIGTILGGILRDWCLNSKYVVILGICLIMLGNSLFLFLHYHFYANLALILVGSGMVISNTPILLSQLSNDSSDKSYTILYGFTNAGVISGSIMGGVFFQHYSWHIMLFLNELVLMLWFIMIAFRHWRREWKGLLTVNGLKVFALLFAVTITAYYYLESSLISVVFLAVTALFYVSFITWLIIKQKKARKSLLYCLLLIFFAIIFFSGEFQVTSSLVDYSKNFVNLELFDINIPAGSLLALESVFVIVGAFLIARIKYFQKIKCVQTKVLLGLFMGLLAFILLYGSTWFAHSEKLSILWVVVVFLFLGFGDVYLTPPIMSYVIRVSPIEYKGRMMAGVYFSLSLSGYLSGFIGSAVAKYFVNPSVNICFYKTIFQVMTLIFVAVVTIMVIGKLIAVFSDRKRQRVSERIFGES